MLIHDTQVRVCYCDTDAMGIVHHANYLKYYEYARTEMLRCHGVSYKEIEAGGVMMPVLGVVQRFLHPAYYDEILTVRNRLESIGGARLTFHGEIYNADGVLVNTADIDIAFVDAATRRPCRMPQKLAEAMHKAGL